MATIGATVLTLVDWAKRQDPNGTIPDIAEMLSQKNEVLMDMLFKMGNLPTGERLVIRTGLPSVAWRLLNQPIATSKSTTAQVDEQCGMLEAWAEVDKDLAELNDDVNGFRLSEAVAFTEALNIEMASTLFYGNSGTDPEKFLGLAPRYAATSAANGSNILKAGGSGSDNTSMWLICWGSNTIYGILPKGSRAGIVHENLGLQTITGSTGIGGTRMRAYQDHWQWKCGIAVKDWRYAVRIPNIDISDLLAITGTQATTASTFLPKLMARALHRVPSMGMGSCVFYANRTVLSNLTVLAMEKATNVLNIQDGLNQFGQPYTSMKFLGIPVRCSDALIETETAVT